MAPSFFIIFAAEKAPTFDIAPVVDYIGFFIYVLLAAVAFWGLYSIILIWRRVKQLSFKDETEQDEYLDVVEQYVQSNQVDELQKLAQDDPRALVQLTAVALRNRNASTEKLQDVLVERFQRDVSAELEYRESWVQTIIKAAPMLGLYGTVVGMMGAFSKLGAATQVSPDKLASDISLALVTTACGMTIAIPLILAMASIHNRTSKLDDLVASGMNRLVEILKGTHS